MDSVEIIKSSITMTQAAERYGYKPTRAGFIICPFHSEGTPSLKLYDRRWRCFGCGYGGDVIDFVSMLLDVGFKDALSIINKDFGLGLPDDRPTWDQTLEYKRKRAEAEARAAKERDEFRVLAEQLRKYRRIIDTTNPVLLPDGDVYYPDELVEARNNIDYIEYLIDEYRAR